METCEQICVSKCYRQEDKEICVRNIRDSEEEVRLFLCGGKECQEGFPKVLLKKCLS